jgi:hypothetical protein
MIFPIDIPEKAIIIVVCGTELTMTETTETNGSPRGPYLFPIRGHGRFLPQLGLLFLELK